MSEVKHQTRGEIPFEPGWINAVGLTLASTILAVLLRFIGPDTMSWTMNYLLTGFAIGVIIFNSPNFVLGHRYYYLSVNGKRIFVDQKGIIWKDGRIHVLVIGGKYDRELRLVDDLPILRINFGGLLRSTKIITIDGSTHHSMQDWKIHNTSLVQVKLRLTDRVGRYCGEFTEAGEVVKRLCQFRGIGDMFWYLDQAEPGLVRIFRQCIGDETSRPTRKMLTIAKLAQTELKNLYRQDGTLRQRHADILDYVFPITFVPQLADGAANELTAATTQESSHGTIR